MGSNDETRYRMETGPDGVVIFVDPGTRVTKKNRHRRIKDGAPKSVRGKPRDKWENAIKIDDIPIEKAFHI